MQELQVIFFTCKGIFLCLRQYNPSSVVGAVAKGKSQSLAIFAETA